MFKTISKYLLFILIFKLFLIQSLVTSSNEERLLNKLKSLNPSELNIIMDTLTREFEYEVEMLSNHDYFMIIKNSIGRMKKTQKYYLMAFITALTLNLREMNSIFDEILFDSDLIENIAHSDEFKYK
jgi:hypothetical protein